MWSASPVGSLSGEEFGQQVGSMLAGLGRVTFFLPYSFYAEHTPNKWFSAGKDADYFLCITSTGVDEIWILETFLANSSVTAGSTY